MNYSIYSNTTKMNSDEETIVENKPLHTESTFNEHVGLKMSKVLETIGVDCHTCLTQWLICLQNYKENKFKCLRHTWICLINKVSC